MDLFLVIIGCVVLFIPGALVYLLISHTGLKQRVATLEDQIRRISQTETPIDNVRQEIEAPKRPAEAPDDMAQTAERRPDRQDQVSTKAPAATAGPPRAVVLTKSRTDALIRWMVANWFYAVSAVSLALAGIFLVQYSIEQGLLPPGARVAAALAFGAILLATGEFIRRRFGDGEDSATAYLPSTFSSAGIVTLFGAILSARVLYGLIGPEVALAGLALVGAVALVLGWFHGPLLAAIGILGATAAPFLVGGSSDNPSWLLGYFAMVTIVGLAIDTVRRWAWISAISLVAGFAAGALLFFQVPASHLILYLAALVVAAIAIPARSLLRPDQGGSMISEAHLIRDEKTPWPEFPTNLAVGALVASCGLIWLATMGTNRPDSFWTAIVVLAALTLAMLVWAKDATALTDQTVLPAAAFVAVIPEGMWLWRRVATEAAEPEADMPLMVTAIVGIGLVLSAAAAWRSLHRDRARILTAVCAAVLAPAVAIAIEIAWRPAGTLGVYVWALHAMAIAGLMVVLAERFARIDGPEDRLRMSLAVLSALASIAFGLVLLFSSAALTVALALTVPIAAWLDRRFALPLMSYYILAGVTTTGYRLVVDPGLPWAEQAPIPELLLSHGGAVLCFAASWWMAARDDRPRTRILLESAVFSATGLLLSLLLFRFVDSIAGYTGVESHWHLGIGATIWLVLGMTQLRRLSMGGPLATLRKLIGAGFLALAALQIFLAVLPFNPLFENGVIVGVPFLNSLLPGYLLPAIVLAIGAHWLADLPRWGRRSLILPALALSALWLGMAVRHFWQGNEAMNLARGIGQAELYSYTVVLLIIGGAVFYQSLARGNTLLRKAGLFVIGLAVAKVFLIDISGLGGLIRVFSLLFLGLALAGLAWLNRWADRRGDGVPKDT